jgi:regulatory protein
LRVTALEKQRRAGRLNLFLDGAFALAISSEVAARAGLRIGGEIDEAALSSLREEAARADAMSSALRLLSYRPRSDSELRQRLARRGAPSDAIEATVGRLAELKLIDDAAFARSWSASRDRSSPRGRRLLKHELLAKGVGLETAREAVSAVDEEAAARARRREG